MLEQLPKPPVTRDQLKMLAAGDNIVTNSDAVDTFGLPLVPLDEQLRRGRQMLRVADEDRAARRKDEGRFRGPPILGTSLYWQRRFLPKRRDRRPSLEHLREPPTLARRFPLQVPGTRPYRLAPPLPVLEISTAGPPPFRG